MKEAKQKKNRRCRECVNVIYGDAERMKKHREEHKVIRRVQALGFVIPKSSQVKGTLV